LEGEGGRRGNARIKQERERKQCNKVQKRVINILASEIEGEILRIFNKNSSAF